VLHFIITIFIFFFALDTSFPKALEIAKAEKNHELGVSQLAKLHVHINIVEWIGEEDNIKPLNRNRKTLEKEKCLSSLMSARCNAMVQSRDEVRTDLINRDECQEVNGKEMILQAI